MSEKKTIKDKVRFTIRADKETEIIIRHSYELRRQKAVLEEKRTPSLNDYILSLINNGLEKEEAM